jgi:hypothetical protein
VQALETLKARLAAINPSLKSAHDGLTASTYTAKGADFQFLNNLLGNNEFRALIKVRLASRCWMQLAWHASTSPCLAVAKQLPAIVLG